MSVTIVLASIGITLLCVLANRWQGRTGLLMGISALAVYALQPALPIRFLDFWLPTATLMLAVSGWALTAPPEQRDWRKNLPAALLLLSIVILLGLRRYLPFSLPLTASRPPQVQQIILGLTLASVLLLALTKGAARPQAALPLAALAILLLFFVLKWPPLTLQASLLLRSWNQQAASTASPFDIRWLGFSYIAFRLLHTLRDRQTGRLPSVSLAEYVTYLVFFPTLPAGPIDRLERFITDLRSKPRLTAEDWLESGKRLFLGLFKKFAIADSLAILALNGVNAWQVNSTFWMWILLYAYTFQIYFDFSGYTDIAIGLGRLLGFKLPENFNAPYLKPNLTQFWNNWHMTLTQWVRAYVFNPLTRALRSRGKPIAWIILIGQITTMAVIGLWHGMTWNFVLWGLWHGLGLFAHNRWSEWARTHLSITPRWQPVLNLGGVLLTFHFVAIGWVFFALPELSSSWHVLGKLFGAA